jgi:hypothetical protein
MRKPRSKKPRSKTRKAPAKPKFKVGDRVAVYKVRATITIGTVTTAPHYKAWVGYVVDVLLDGDRRSVVDVHTSNLDPIEEYNRRVWEHNRRVQQDHLADAVDAVWGARKGLKPSTKKKAAP